MAEQVTALNTAGQNAPVNFYNTGAYGSPDTIATGGTQTLLLAPEVDPNIIDSFPSMFTDVAFMMSLPTTPATSLNPNWAEEPYLVAPLGVRANVASPGLNTQQVVPITDATRLLFGVNDKVLYPDGQSGLVIAVDTTPGAATATVRPISGGTLPALTTDDILGNRGPTTADGVSDVPTVFDPQIAGFNNVIEAVGPVAVRWDPMQLREWELTGTTDYVSKKMSSAYKRFLIGMHQTIWMSQRGAITLQGGQTARFTSGFLEQQANSGVPNQPCTPATFVDVIRNTIFDTALTGESERVIFATRRVLNIIGTSQKAEKIRYTPNDKRWNLDIYEYEFYGHKLILVPMDQWEDTGSYGNLMRNQVVMMNKSDISLKHMSGFPMISEKYELLNRERNPGNLFNFKLVYWTGNVCPILKRAWATGRFTVNGI